MNVLMICSANKEIDNYYLSVTRSVAEYLANQEFDLVFGAGSSSMMGICYDSFSKKNRDVYAFTTEKYRDDLINLPNAKHFVMETTFDLKQAMFLHSDLVVCLPGGVGTFSEVLSFIEEKRSNNKDIPIIIYDENKFYDKFINIINDLIKEKFVDKEILDMFTITTNKYEFENEILKLERGKIWKN